MPIQMDTQSGFKDTTSRSKRCSRSRLVFPLIPEFVTRRYISQVECCEHVLDNSNVVFPTFSNKPSPHRLCTFHIRYGISCKYNPVHVIKNHFFASLGHNNRSKKTSKSHYNLVISTVQGRFCKFKAILKRSRQKNDCEAPFFSAPQPGNFFFLQRFRAMRSRRKIAKHACMNEQFFRSFI